MLVLTLVPVLLLGRTGWWNQNYSILYGPAYYYENVFYHSFDFQYDSQKQSCTTGSSFKGFALSSSFDNQLQELGIRGFINPTRISFGISKSIRAFPYMYVQQNMERENKEIKKSNLNTRPGIGISGIVGFGNSITSRFQIQGGYSLNRDYLDNGNGLVIEFKVGLGIDLRKVRSRKRE